MKKWQLDAKVAQEAIASFINFDRTGRKTGRSKIRSMTELTMTELTKKEEENINKIWDDGGYSHGKIISREYFLKMWTLDWTYSDPNIKPEFRKNSTKEYSSLDISNQVFVNILYDWLSEQISKKCGKSPSIRANDSKRRFLQMYRVLLCGSLEEKLKLVYGALSKKIATEDSTNFKKLVREQHHLRQAAAGNVIDKKRDANKLVLRWLCFSCHQFVFVPLPEPTSRSFKFNLLSVASHNNFCQIWHTGI
jgi:hypothetical protein